VPTEMRLLVTVKTYPLPSMTPHMEVVCTAGVREDGSFVRLLPIDFRYRPYWERFKKYQWIEAVVVKHKHDRRPESFIPVPDTDIKVIPEPLSSASKWAERKRYVLAREPQTMCSLNSLPVFTQSLGLVKPREVLDIVVREGDREWKPEWQQLFRSERLFGPKQKPLEKIPYEFSYKFLCADPECGGHEMMIADWELGQLYREMRDQHGEEAATAKVRQKFLTQMCGPRFDTHFFVGTTLAHPKSWIVLGVFWPKK
jgi:hypothetical protein